MTRQDFMDALSQFRDSGTYYVYTGILGQSVGALKYFYGCPEVGEPKQILFEKMFESFMSEYPDGIEDVVVVDMGKVSLKGGVLTCIDFTDTTISSIINP